MPCLEGSGKNIPFSYLSADLNSFNKRLIQVSNCINFSVKAGYVTLVDIPQKLQICSKDTLFKSSDFKIFWET